jgi:Tfp pilus assembly protein PilX
MKNTKNKQSGAVSLFVVIFTALLITVVTVSFVRIMVQDQQQATVTDLSQSAYDSAQAGVEDAKRALLRLQKIVSDGGSVNTDEWSTDCNVAVQTLDDVPKTSDEIKVQTGGANSLDQAYTCVKVELNTPDYLGELSNNSYNFIPLRGVDSSFDTVKIEWFSPNDVDSTVTKFTLQSDSQTPLPSAWSPDKPPIIRAQLAQFDKEHGFNLTDFDFNITDYASSQSNANTLFLYPSSVGKNEFNFILDDVRQTVNSTPGPVAAGHPQSVLCTTSIASLYSCSAEIKLPTTIGTGEREAYLFIGALYNKASYKVSMINGTTGEVVNFSNVQPEVDSTGRTSDLFRRVQTRVELTDINFPYPRAAVDVAGSLCKDFKVTDNTDDWSKINSISGTNIEGCTP